MGKINVFIITFASALFMWGSAFAQDPQPPQDFLLFDGYNDYVEVPDSTDFSVNTTGHLTVSAWMRPDTLTFPNPEVGGDPTNPYVHWLGKGEAAKREWTFRMYSNPDGDRANRISFYVFNLEGRRGCGSYFQDPIQAGLWVLVVGTADMDTQRVAIHKNEAPRHSDSFSGIISPDHGASPLRMGTRDFASFFQGALAKIRIWSRVLSDQEISDLYYSDLVPQDQLVAEWRLDEGSGDTAHDSAGGHDGMLFGSMTWSSDSGSINTDVGHSGGGC